MTAAECTWLKTKKTAEGQQEEERQKENVPAAGDGYDSAEHKAPERKAHRGQRSSPDGSRLPAFAKPRLIM